MRPSAKLASALGVVCMLCLLGYAASRVAERGRFASAYSTYSAGPNGARGLYRLTQELGFTARRLTREPTGMGPGTLVVLGACSTPMLRPPLRPELEAIAAWVERGGLLIVSERDDFVPPAAGISIDAFSPCSGAAQAPFSRWLEAQQARDDTDGPIAIDVRAVGPPLTHLAPFEVPHVTPLHIGIDSHATQILQSELGPVGLTVPVGRGRVVLLGMAEALTNARLQAGAGVAFARLLSAFAPKGPVFFDEYHLGMGDRRSLVRYLRDAGYGPALVQGMLVIFALLFAGAGHIAPPRKRRRAARDFPPFADTLGHLYARTQDGTNALRVLSEHTLSRIARRYHATSVPRHELSAWLARQGLAAVALYTARVAEHGRTPLGPGETLVERAHAIERDGSAAVALGDAP